jgi:putative colanic acid biosynthesis acetyltransferase WcaF
MSPLEASETRPLEGGASFTLANRLTRLVWNIVWFLACAWTPRTFHPWRRFLLRLFGAKMGHCADVRATARVWLPSNLQMGAYSMIGPGVICYNQGPISIGDHSLVSQRAHLCAGSHKIDDLYFQLVVQPIVIGERVWIAAEAFVGPGTVIGDRAVLGARGVAFGTLEPNCVYRGNPAVLLRERRLEPVVSGSGIRPSSEQE